MLLEPLGFYFRNKIYVEFSENYARASLLAGAILTMFLNLVACIELTYERQLENWK